MIRKPHSWAAAALQAPLIPARQTAAEPGAASAEPSAMQAAEPFFEGVYIDSRTAGPGGLYVPLAGARVDGHDFVGQAAERGCTLTLWQKDKKPYPENIAVIPVDDPLSAMQQLSKAWASELSCDFIGVTGSNGKTSVKDMLASILSREFRTGKTEGNHNNEIGMPLTLFSLDADTEKAVLEMGLEFKGDVSFLCSLVTLKSAVISSIGSAHMENFGSRLEIARGKCEILEGLRNGGLLIYDKDSPEIEEILESRTLPSNVKTCSFGHSENADLQIENLQAARKGIAFSIPALDEKPFEVPALGLFQASNAAAAAAAALSAGASMDAVHEGLANVILTPMRGQPYPLGKAVLIDDTYKSNPEAAAASLKMLMQVPAAKHIAVLADMLDLGEQEEELHLETGRLARKLGVDLLFAYGERGKKIAQGFGDDAVWVSEKEELEDLLWPLRNEDAAILVKGSRAMKMDEIVKNLLEREKNHETC